MIATDEPKDKPKKENNDRKHYITYYERKRLSLIKNFPDCVEQHNFPDCPNTIEDMEREDIDNCVKCPYGGTHLRKLYDYLIIKQPIKKEEQKLK